MPGDCGAWAIDESTHEVYGHVVASDAFSETYVIPFGATCKDIEHRLGAEAVYLPGVLDNVPFFSWEQMLEEDPASDFDHSESLPDSGYASKYNSPARKKW